MFQSYQIDIFQNTISWAHIPIGKLSKKKEPTSFSFFAVAFIQFQKAANIFDKMIFQYFAGMRFELTNYELLNEHSTIQLKKLSQFG